MRRRDVGIELAVRAAMDAARGQDIAAAVRVYHARMTALEQVLDDLGKPLKVAPESPLLQAVWALATEYRKALDSQYAIGEWLEWWWLECQLGAHPMQAKPAHGKLRTVATVDALVRLVLDDAGLTEGARCA